MAGRRVKLARGPALKGSCKLSPADAERLALLIREHGHDGAARRLRVSPALVDKLTDGGAALPDSVRRMTEALRRPDSVGIIEKQTCPAEREMLAGDVVALLASVLEEMETEMNRQQKVEMERLERSRRKPG